MEQGASFQFVAYDHEPVDIAGARANDLPAEQFAANARAFCDTVAEAGFEPMVYGNQSDLGRLTVEERRAWPLWLAEYGVEAPTAPYAFPVAVHQQGHRARHRHRRRSEHLARDPLEETQ